MAKGDALKAALAARIKASAISLTVHYPAQREGVTGVAPMARPLNPLSGPEPELSTTPAEPTPVSPALTMKCLWLDATSLALGGRGRSDTPLGVVEGATALARVLAKDALKDTADPSAGTVFEGAEVVECNGRRYRVLRVDPISASFYAPHTYAVWLSGAVQQ